MLLFVVIIISIEVIQEWKTDQTLKALKDLSAPRITVLRDGVEKEINSADLVPGDVMLIAEGVKVPADGMAFKASTLRVDESSLTGESEGVWKVTTGNADKKTLNIVAGLIVMLARSLPKARAAFWSIRLGWLLSTGKLEKM